MDNDARSLSETTIDCSPNIERTQNTDQRCDEPRIEEESMEDKTDPELVLDLRGVLSVCEQASENEDSVEKLSAVLEQPEDSSVTMEDVQSLLDDHANRNHVLRERVESLREIMKCLKEELQNEVQLWRKEREELQLLREKDSAMALHEATAAARAAAAAYAAESPLSNKLGDVLDLGAEDTFRELTILEYEKRLAKYQDSRAYDHAEKRYNACWISIANIYKQKLMEIERLCNVELEKVQQNASTLQPLKEMVSQWYVDEKNHGDTARTCEIYAGARKSVADDENQFSDRKFQKIDAEVNMTPEIFVAKFKSDNLTSGKRHAPF
nr:uncharacterized protein LOC117222157 [Megalopta genalis]XP_033329593.1 uncharacterized protein LOC117222157 [Megalopta genalis]